MIYVQMTGRHLVIVTEIVVECNYHSNVYNKFQNDLQLYRILIILIQLNIIEERFVVQTSCTKKLRLTIINLVLK